MRDPVRNKQGAGQLKWSAGILVYRKTGHGVEVLLGHPGGPFWKNKDNGSWSIPKGELGPGEEPEAAALREFREETSWTLPPVPLQQLAPVKLKSGKWVQAWMVEAYRPAPELKSNEFEMEWPPRSGRQQSFPEMDRFDWFDVDTAKEKINPGQQALLDQLQKKLAGA